MLYSINMWSTLAVWKQYNKMTVLHIFLVNSSLYTLFSMAQWHQRLNIKFNHNSMTRCLGEGVPANLGKRWGEEVGWWERMTTLSISIIYIHKHRKEKFLINSFSVFTCKLVFWNRNKLEIKSSLLYWYKSRLLFRWTGCSWRTIISPT